jgi:hypothetical protein
VAEAVAQHSLGVAGRGDRHSLATITRVSASRVEQRQCALLLPPPPGEHQRRAGEGRVTRCRRNGIRLLDEGAGSAELSAIQGGDRSVRERVRKNRENAGVSRKLQLDGGQRVPGFVIPEICRDTASQPQPARGFVTLAAVGNSVEHLPEVSACSLVAPGESDAQAVEQQVNCPGRSWQSLRHRHRDGGRAAAMAQSTSEDGRHERL